MSVSGSLDRVWAYYGRHGFGATLRRACLAIKRGLFSARMVVFSCDLAEQALQPVAIPSSMKIERLMIEAELNPRDLAEMTSFWVPEQACRNIKERFAKGASLWLIKSEGNLAGYGWTLQGRTIEPYYLPFGQSDVHLFDFHVFPQYRGQGVNPYLVTHILRNLATSSRGRAFIEAAEWNQAQLSSLRKTPFRRVGLAKVFSVFGHRFTRWTACEPGEHPCRAIGVREEVRAMAKTPERRKLPQRL